MGGCHYCLSLHMNTSKVERAKKGQKSGVVIYFHQWGFVDGTLPLTPRHG